MRTQALALAALAIAPMLVGATAPSATQPIAIMMGRSQVMESDGALTRVAISDPRIMDVRVIGKNQLLVQALRPGTSTLWVWTKKGAARQYEVRVDLDAAEVERQVRRLTGNGALKVGFNGHAYMITGDVPSDNQKTAVEKIVASYGRPVVNLVQLTTRQEQIAIDVHVVELTRTGSLNLGVAFGGGEVTEITNGIRKYVFKPWEMMFGEQVTGNPSTMSQLDFLAIKLEALQKRGDAKLLARPTLVTTDGGTAKFLAGGEIPIPVQQALGTTTIMWKEFGVRLEIQPRLLDGDRVALAVKPEVSSLDFGSGLKQASFTIPALRSRRAETQVILGAQETLMLGGLLNNEDNKQWEAIPGIGDVPVLGELFKSRRFIENQSELAILVTPRLVRPDASPKLPGRLPQIKSDLEGK